MLFTGLIAITTVVSTSNLKRHAAGVGREANEVRNEFRPAVIGGG